MVSLLGLQWNNRDPCQGPHPQGRHGGYAPPQGVPNEAQRVSLALPPWTEELAEQAAFSQPLRSTPCAHQHTICSERLLGSKNSGQRPESSVMGVSRGWSKRGTPSTLSARPLCRCASGLNAVGEDSADVTNPAKKRTPTVHLQSLKTSLQKRQRSPPSTHKGHNSITF
jgi:hypothetical protein